MGNANSLTNRNASIDRFRGMVIFSMIFFQFAAHFKNLGVFADISSHAPDENAIYIFPNFAVADIVAPMFILAIGLTFLPSLYKRMERDGVKAAVTHCVQRYMLFIGIGVFMDGVNDVLDGKFDDKLCLSFIIPTILTLVLFILWLVLKLAKAKKAASVIGKASGVLLIALGVYGVALALVNAVMLVLGKTADSFGHWLVLHHIGFAGLVALPFVLIKGKYASVLRLAGGLALLAVYALFHEGNLANDLFNSNMELIDEVADGGFIGGFGWGAMLVLFLFFADLYYKNKKNYYIGLGIFAIPAIAFIVASFMSLPEGYSSLAGQMGSILPINKGSVSPGFIIIATFMSLVGFTIFDLFNFYKLAFDPLSWWGKNPMLMYCLEFGFVGGIAAAAGDFFETASVPVSIIIIAVVTIILTAIAYILNKKNKILKI